jgi:hypothetical protein
MRRFDSSRAHQRGWANWQSRSVQTREFPGSSPGPRTSGGIVQRQNSRLLTGQSWVRFPVPLPDRSRRRDLLPYDVNTNTNYNPDAEARAGRSGMVRFANYLGAEFERLFRRHAPAD